MARIEKTVFISYRRTDEAWGLAVFQDLTHHGYDVFIDYDGIASGNFETVILENIRARAHFLVLLTPTALERCSDPNDWMRREIEAALASQRNIVPLMLAGFNFGAPATASQLTGKLAVLKKYNALPIPQGYFSPAMERLRNKFLNLQVDAVLHPASDSAQQAAKEQKDKATMVLGDALHQPSLSPEELRKQEEAEAKRRAEETRQRAADEERRREVEMEQRRKEEAEAKRQEDEAQRRREVEAARKAEAERKRAEVERRGEEERKRAESQAELELEARRKAVEEVEARRKVEEERYQREVAAQRQAEVAKRRAEEETQQRVEKARRNREAERAQRRKEQAEAKRTPSTQKQSWAAFLGIGAVVCTLAAYGLAAHFSQPQPSQPQPSQPQPSQPQPTCSDTLCGTVWSYTTREIPSDHHVLEFVPGKIVQWPGTKSAYSLTGNSIRFEAIGSRYDGTIRNNQMSGTLTNEGGKFTWTATKQ